MSPPCESYEDWPAIGEVMERTGLSERSVYRAVNGGKLRSAQRPIAGRKPLPVYHPDDVKALQQQTQVPFVIGIQKHIPPMSESRQNVPPPEFWEALVDALRPHPAALPPPAAEPAESKPEPVLPSLAELRQKLIVTRAEAKRLGFTARILDAVERFPGGRYKMRDLESL